MEIRQLKYFLTIVKHNHFTLAADELCLSQSSLSKHIKSLEEELGVKLIDRSTRNISITPFGMEFVEFSKKVLSEYDDINLKLKKYKIRENKGIRIGAVSDMNQNGITSLIASFQKKYPDIQVEIKQMKTKELLNFFKLGEIDVAFFAADLITDINFDAYPIMQDELVVITDINSRFDNYKKISYSKISNEKFIFLNLHLECMKFVTKYVLNQDLSLILFINVLKLIQ